MAIPPSPSGPHSSEHSSGDDLRFDPDSPDLDDPQVDPTGPAKARKTSSRTMTVNARPNPTTRWAISSLDVRCT